jgi:hypothetical protein
MAGSVGNSGCALAFFAYFAFIQCFAAFNHLTNEVIRVSIITGAD